MPLRRHWAHFRYYDCSFTGSEAVDYLHELLRRNYNFGPEVTRYQTLQLLRKFLKAHVIEDIKGRHGTEDFEDNSHLYRYFFVMLCCYCHLSLETPQGIVAVSSEHALFLLRLSPVLFVCLSRFPTLSPLKSFPSRPLLRDSCDLPRLIRWDDYEELPQQENIAPLKSAVMVRERQRCFGPSCVCFDACSA